MGAFRLLTHAILIVMKLLIVTTDKPTLFWGSLDDKLSEIKRALNFTQNKSEDWEVEIIYKDLVPEVKNGRITHSWFDSISYPLFKQGNHFVALHMSEVQKDKWGIKPGLRGSNQRDSDLVGDMYFWSDEATQRSFGQSQFVQTCLHECSHELANTIEGHGEDKTHEYHGRYSDISGIFETYDVSRWQPKYQLQVKIIDILRRIVNLLLLQTRKFDFFTVQYPVSQPYGVKNPAWYPITKHHIGTDFATPVGTPIIAPADCEVVRSDRSDTLGYWCEIKLAGKYYSFMHLKSEAVLGKRKKGWVIAFTGNTGFTTNPHCHIEGWNRPRDLTIINENNYKNYTFNIR